MHPCASASALTGNELNSAPGTLENPAGNFYTTWSPDTGGGTTAADALAVNSYLFLIVTPEAGKSTTLSSLSFDVFAATTGPSPRQLYIFSDKTGFTDGSELFTASTTTGSSLIPYNTSPGQNFQIDLSGIAALSQITNSVTFRFYIATPTTYQNIGFDDITVEGMVGDVTSVLGDVSIVMEGASTILSWEADAWASYGIQTNGDLVEGSWGTTQSNLTGVSGTMSVTNTIPDADALFYRVILED